jgi:hypothetical protein
LASRSARSRNRQQASRRNRWLPLTPEEQLARQPQRHGPLLQPWREHPTLVSHRERLQLVADCWNLLAAADGRSRRSVYLPRGAQEPETSYQSRIENARPTGFFRDALRTYAGMLSCLHWQALPASLQSVLTDVDGQGTDLGVFLFIADLLVLRDGGCLILVLPPEHRWPSEGHRQEALGCGDRLSLPRLALVPRGDLLDWQLPNPNGLPVRLTLREDRRQPLTPDQFGAVPVHLLGPDPATALPDPTAWTYRTLQLRPAGLELTISRAVADPAAPGGHAAEPIGPPLLIPGQHQLPCVWYAADGAAFGEGDLPHLGLAHQYLTHYRLKSEYEDLLSRCALPVGVRTGLVDQFGLQRDEDGAPRPPQQLVLSTNTFMDLPDGADFNWKEIRARSLAEHRAYLTLLDDTMRRDALVPSANRGPGKTETEVSLTAGQAYALLQSLATQKTSVFSTVLEHWCRATGDSLQSGAGVSLTVTPLTPPLRPQPSVGEWLTLHERGVVSSAELRHQLALSAAPGLVNPIGSTAAGGLGLPPDAPADPAHPSLLA